MYWIKGITATIKITFKIWKEVFIAMMGGYVFAPDSPLVKAHVLLFMAEVYTSIEEVPDIFNLREAVLQAMGLTKTEEN